LIILVPVCEDVVADMIVSTCFGVFDLSFVGFDCYLSFIENPVLEKSATLTFKRVDFYFPSGPTAPTNYDGFGKFTFFLEPGLRLISGKNDSPLFYIFYDFYVF
jgi:hypothetical protein